MRRGCRLMAMLSGILALAACGSSVNPATVRDRAERTRLVSELNTSLASDPTASVFLDSTDPSGQQLISCIVGQARGLPLPQLRQVAQPNPKLGLALRLLGECLERGRGVAAFQSLIRLAVLSDAPATLPVALRRCIATAAQRLPGPVLGRALISIGPLGWTGAQRRLGQIMAPRFFYACAPQWRDFVADTAVAQLRQHRFAPGYVRCVAQGMHALPPSRVAALLVVHLRAPAGAADPFFAVGEQIGRACVIRLGLTQRHA